MSENKYNTIIVGGGMAGLTAAAFLSRAGQKVLLLENPRECGGLVNSFTREGFHFDAGVRALEDAGIIFPMLKDLGIDLEVIKSPVSVGLENEILHIENFDSLVKYRDLLDKIKKAGWLDEFITDLENRVLKVIADSVYPMLNDKIILRFLFSPLNIESRVGSSEGAITSWSFEKTLKSTDFCHPINSTTYVFFYFGILKSLRGMPENSIK